jgi:hypothetical protein
LEEIMKTQTFAIAVLALGVATAASPALAQTYYGRPLNDGGLVQQQAQQGDYYAPQTSSSAHSSAPAYYGRPLNDGGMAPEPSGQRLYNSAPQQAPSTPPHYGRPLNDGGF